MSVETEVKYLVADNWKESLTGGEIKSVSNIKQGYLSTDPERTVRVRLLTQNQTSEAFITIKGKRNGLSCPEYEYRVPFEDGLQLIAMCSNVIDKTRHVVVTEQDQRWEVDVFHGLNDGLILGEMEFEGEENAPMFVPEWAVEDVSFDHRYTNAQLSSNKAPCLAVV